MRFTKYKSIIEMIDSVIEATEYMKKNNTPELCSICVQSLKSVIRTLESEPGNENLVSQICLAVECFGNGEYGSDVLYNLMIEISEKSRTELHYRLRVLFVAELGGKWDSMASVYDAFIKRPDCDVEVILQPIFRINKLPDGSERKDILYDDYLTELGIKFHEYDQYDISVQKPDITFISQPYESVTLPMFWPENISKYSHLVYLPYYTATLLNRYNYVAYDSFFELNTQKYSWKIACQSEEMKEAYRKYGSCYGENTIVSGLPKWDYPMSLDIINTPCPEKWKKKIENRKVFLFNTHFDTLSLKSLFSEKGEAFFKKFSCDKSIALLWRPHPMTNTIIKVYLPEYEKKYRKLLQMIEKSDNLLIDEEKLYSYSFVWSDALISLKFPSSMITQYMFTGKSVATVVFDDDMSDFEMYKYDTTVFDFSAVPVLKSSECVNEYIDSVKNGERKYHDIINELRNKYFYLADGKCGERFAEKIVDAFDAEFVADSVNKSQNKVLLIGKSDESAECIKAFKTNKIEFNVCLEFWDSSDYYGCQMSSISDADQFDCVIITCTKNSDQIKEYIIRNSNIASDSVLVFQDMISCFSSGMLCDSVLKCSEHVKYDGLLLGSSRMKNGIVTSRLPGKVCDLSVPLQDMFFQLKTLEYALKNYASCFSKMKYVVIELYDYNYFNIDISKTNKITDYIAEGGYNLAEHNFPHDSLYSFDELKSIILSNGINEKMKKLWNKLFKDYDFNCCESYTNDNLFSQKIGVLSKEMIDSFDYGRSEALELSGEVIKENVQYFGDFLRKLTDFNPDIEIFALVIPAYWEKEMLDFRKKQLHKDYFESVIFTMKKHYNLKYLDYNEISAISLKKQLYFNAEHLNYFGAIELTDSLTKIINN